MGRVVERTTVRANHLIESLAQEIRQRRKDLGFTMAQLAQQSGISRVTLHRIESGRTSVSVAAIAAVAGTMGMRLSLVPAPIQLRRQIRLADYPGLQSLGWQLSPHVELSSREAWSLYAHNWRHLDHSLVAAEERELIQELESAYGPLPLPTGST